MCSSAFQILPLVPTPYCRWMPFCLVTIIISIILTFPAASFWRARIAFYYEGRSRTPGWKCDWPCALGVVFDYRLPAEHTSTVTATPARHGPAGGDRGPVIGFVLTDCNAGENTTYISGDTVWYEGLAEVAARFEIHYAVLFMGAARVAGRWSSESDAYGRRGDRGGENFTRRANHSTALRRLAALLREPPRISKEHFAAPGWKRDCYGASPAYALTCPPLKRCY